jgi:hypothetical protein
VPGDGGGQEKDPVLLQGWCCNTDKKTTVCFVFPLVIQWLCLDNLVALCFSVL